MFVENEQAGQKRESENIDGGDDLSLLRLEALLLVGHHAHRLADGDHESLLDQRLGGRHQGVPRNEVARLHVYEVTEDASASCGQSNTYRKTVEYDYIDLKERVQLFLIRFYLFVHLWYIFKG